MDDGTITDHPYFGRIRAEGFDLRLHPARLAGRGIACRIACPGDPAAQYARMLPHLAAFAAFCDDLEESDRGVREHLAGRWPASAGEVRLTGVVMSGISDILPWSLDRQDGRPFALSYRALDQDAWDYAGIHRHPADFHALFDAGGTFHGIEDEVDAKMRALPPLITPPRWRNGYRHPVFGRCELSELSRIGTATVAGRRIPVDLFMSTRRMSTFEPEDLDAFVPLVRRVDALDARVRADFPPEIRRDWLEHRWDDRAALGLGRVLPGLAGKTARADQVSPQAFAAALRLRRACLSLSPEESGAAALTLDYGILPLSRDQYVFAAKFSVVGDLLEIVEES